MSNLFVFQPVQKAVVRATFWSYLATIRKWDQVKGTSGRSVLFSVISYNSAITLVFLQSTKGALEENKLVITWRSDLRSGIPEALFLTLTLRYCRWGTQLCVPNLGLLSGEKRLIVFVSHLLQKGAENRHLKHLEFVFIGAESWHNPRSSSCWLLFRPRFIRQKDVTLWTLYPAACGGALSRQSFLTFGCSLGQRRLGAE